MKQVILLQMVFIILVAILVDHFLDRDLAKGYLLGGGLGLFSLASLWYSLRPSRIKKRVASSVAVIVIKYAILGFAVCLMAGKDELHQIYFALGLATTVLTALGTAVIQSVWPDPLTEANGAI